MGGGTEGAEGTLRTAPPPLSRSPNSNQTPPTDPAQAFNVGGAAGEVHWMGVGVARWSKGLGLRRRWGAQTGG